MASSHFALLSGDDVAFVKEVGSCCSFEVDTKEKPYLWGFATFLVDCR